ncbi:MAG: HDOD domain-containing protein [Sterolibacterium sp.]|nr:HDOD domain-containing protein [Sterolibacterium sp.]
MPDSVHDIRQRLLIAKLPALPEILIKLIRLCQVEEVGMSELASLIAKDAAMATRILSAASSSLYAGRGHKPGLKQSLQTLGMDTAKTLLTCESVFQVFNGLGNSSAFDLRGFWRHALMTAESAKRIAASINYPHQEEAYLAGLLHDVGRLALFSVAPKKYALLASQGDDANLCLAEQRILHITHAEAGSLLIERWGFDSYLADSVLYHHEPVARATGTHPLIRLVILADAIASQGANQPARDIAQALCTMEAEVLTKICADSAEQVRQAAVLLNLDLSPTEPLLTPPASTARATSGSRQQLAVEVQQLILGSEAQRFFSRQADAVGVISAIRQSAALLFGFGDALVLLSDDATHCLHGVAVESGWKDHSEFMMPIDDGGAVSASMSQGRVVFIESDTRLPRLSEEQQLLLQICNGRVKPNARPESANQTETGDRTNETTHTALSLAEEQLLRLLDAEYLVCVPLLHGTQCRGVLLGVTLAIQVSELQLREPFLMAFARQAAVALDAANRKEDQERRSEARVAAEYRLASRRVIHEVSNPLSIIKNYLAVLGHKAARQESVTAEIVTLGAEIDRVSHLLQGLQEIKPKPSDQPIEIDRIVEEVVNTFCALRPTPAATSIKTRLQAATAQLKAHGDTLKQILFNLLNNAIEALPDGGKILIATNGAINRDGRLYCGLTVEDNGPGIAPDILARLFSPLATSKGGDHMGLGLSIVYDLVRQLEGTITCHSNGDGTSFEILLPISDTSDYPHTRSPKK